MVRSTRKKKDKSSLDWRGPLHFVIVNSDLVFELKELMKAKRYVAHAQRFLLYSAVKQERSAPTRLLKQAAPLENAYHIIDCIEDIRKGSGQFEAKIEQLGYEEDGFIWEPSLHVKEDVPGLLEDDLHTREKRYLKRNELDLYF